jgi:glucose/arabinose dehydrogenase
LRQLLFVRQPYANHNGGQLQFGPDGWLYVGMGDGGGSYDPQDNAQNPNQLLGKMLRIDINVPDSDAVGYRVPFDNPFVDGVPLRALGEIWAFGLRNPWRFAFDRAAGTLYIADVGQNQWEEVHVVTANRPGVNYGWRIMEGSRCFGAATCNTQGLEIPVVEYSHDEGCSITGGFVYRGARIPAIQGHYFYSDYCRGFLRSFRFENGRAVDARSWDLGGLGSVSSFGEDAAGELYIPSATGRVYRLEPE